MKKQKKSILELAMFSFFCVTMVFFSVVSATGGESEKHDQSKILPANDGDADGCNSSRFECVMGGEAVLDKKTGLIWARNANLAGGTKPWQEAVEFCQNLVIGNRKGWRLPTKEELADLLDALISNPSRPFGRPFKNAKRHSTFYWSSTKDEGDSSRAWVVGIYYEVTYNLEIFDSSVWPVLGGN